jgi:hypothetical protein
VASSATSENVPANVGTTEDVPANIGATTEDVPTIASANYVATTKGGTTAKRSRFGQPTSSDVGCRQSKGKCCSEIGCSRFGAPIRRNKGEKHRRSEGERESRQEFGSGRVGPPTSRDTGDAEPRALEKPSAHNMATISKTPKSAECCFGTCDFEWQSGQ